MKKAKLTIFVGLSGGVDSSVAAKRLVEAGHTVIGVFIKTWHPAFLACTEESDRLDAMRVAAHLNIPFLTFDAVEAYKSTVADYMIREYAEGRTPNPDVMCNKNVKFGAFLDWALKQGADAVATGHYARIEVREGVPVLLRGKDPDKDQSYFLWSLSHEKLSRIIFPLGESMKHNVRKEAEGAGIPVFDKRDSQGICFLGDVDIKGFLSHYIPLQKGNVLDTEGNIVGTHSGSLIYTLGERHGFTIAPSSALHATHYIVSKDHQSNTITVSDKPLFVAQGSGTLKLKDCVIRTNTLPQILSAQFRYRQKPFTASLREEVGCVMLTVLDTHIEQPPKGQSCVFYDNEVCIGGGIIS